MIDRPILVNNNMVIVLKLSLVIDYVLSLLIVICYILLIEVL